MKNNKIIRAIGGIDDELIERAAPKNKKIRNRFVPWLKWVMPVAACLIVAVVIIIVPLLNNNGNNFILNLSSGNVSVRYADKLPNLPSVSNMLIYLTEDELFHKYDTDIFSGTIKEIRNIEIDFNGHTDYRAFAKIKVDDVIRGDIKSGDIVSVLLPVPINVKGLWVEDTDVISQMKAGMSGIFMPLKYDESHYREEAGAKLYFVDIAKYGLLDGERYVFLDTPKNLVFAQWAYESIANATTLYEVKQYINVMLERDRQDFEPMYIGLPVDNFNLAELHNSIEADRRAYSKLSDFFSQYNGVPDMFVFAKVIDTEQIDETPRYSASNNIRQNSSVEILSVIWNRDGSTLETISVTQYLFGGCCADEPTNLLRKGGVYLLPLTYWEQTDTWRIVDDLDVLFEVDDKGRVWSHSKYEDFKRFDGKDANILLEAITAFTSDENFSAAVSRFGLIVRSNWAILMEATFVSVIPMEDKWDNNCYENTFIVDNIISTAENLKQPDTGDEIQLISYSSLTSIHLEQGGWYLIFCAPYEDGAQIDTESIAKINDDGTISEIFTPDDYRRYHRAFEGYNGYTVEQMQKEAERAKAWNESHVK